MREKVRNRVDFTSGIRVVLGTLPLRMQLTAELQIPYSVTVKTVFNSTHLAGMKIHGL